MAPVRPYDHLKRDLPTNLALLATIASAALPVLSMTFLAVPHGYVEARSHPLYWLLMAPLAVWAWGAISFDAWAIRLVTPLPIAAPLCGALIAFLSRTAGDDRVVVWTLAAGSLFVSLLGAVALRRSPLWSSRKA